MAGSPQDGSTSCVAFPSRLVEPRPGKEALDENQVRYRLHARGTARLLRSARRQADAGRADAGGRRAAARQCQGARPRDHAEDLAAGRAQGVRAAAGDVPEPDGRPPRREEIAVAVALRTARLLLRGWRDEDVEPFAMMSADPEVLRYLPAPDEGWVARQRAHFAEHGFGNFVVELPSEAPFIGVIGLNHVRWALAFTPAVE